MFALCVIIFIVILLFWFWGMRNDSRNSTISNSSGDSSTSNSSIERTPKDTNTSTSTISSGSLKRANPSTNAKTNKYSTVSSAPRYKEFVDITTRKRIYTDQDDCNSFLIEVLKLPEYTNLSNAFLSFVAETVRSYRNVTHLERIDFLIDSTEHLVVNQNISGNRRVIFRGNTPVTDLSVAALMYRIYCDLYDCSNVNKNARISSISMDIGERKEDYTKSLFTIKYKLN